MERPIWVAQHFACEQDEIGRVGADDLVGLGGRGDLAYCRGRDFGFAADLRGEGNLVAGAGGNGSAGDVAPGGDVDEIDAMLLEDAGQRDRLIDIPAAVCPFGGGDADEERQIGGPLGADCIDGFDEQTDAVLEAAAVVAGAAIR